MPRPAAFLTTATLVFGLLGACSQEPAEPDAVVTSEAAAATSEANTTPVAEATSEAAPDVAANAIPEGLRGRWGLVPADCTSTRGDAKGLLEISADRLKFYESVGRLGAIRGASAMSVDATFAFTGEGQNWMRDMTLSSPDGGKTLVRKESGADAVPEPLIYTRCP